MNEHMPTCCSCHSASLNFVLSLGQIPDSETFLTESACSRGLTAYPLVVFFCSECALMQIGQPSPLAARLRRHASISARVKGAGRLEPGCGASDLIEARALRSSSLVVNIGSDDQSMLNDFVERGVSVVDVRSCDVVNRTSPFVDSDELLPSFTARRASVLRGQSGSADVIMERNVLERADDPDDFVEGMHILLKDDGLAVIEVPYVRDLVERCAFDLIAHDQLCYFSFTALRNLLGRHSLFVSHAERFSNSGGTLRVYAGRDPKCDRSVGSLLEEEAFAGVDRPAYYETFAGRVATVRDWLLDLLWGVKSRGKRVAAYWADLRAATIVNCLGAGTELIDFVADPHTDLHGYYLGGKYIPIKPCETLVSGMPDYVLLLRWERAEDVFDHESEYLRRGGIFVTPLPYPVCTSQRTRERVV